MVKVSNNAGLDDYFKDFPDEPTDREKNHNKAEIRFRVAVIKARPSRHSGFDFVREMGAAKIEDVLKQRPLKGNLTFVFPERHLSVREQQAFTLKLINNPTANLIESVDYITSCPMMISDFYNEQVRILTFEDDEEI